MKFKWFKLEVDNIKSKTWKNCFLKYPKRFNCENGSSFILRTKNFGGSFSFSALNYVSLKLSYLDFWSETVVKFWLLSIFIISCCLYTAARPTFFKSQSSLTFKILFFNIFYLLESILPTFYRQFFEHILWPKNYKAKLEVEKISCSRHKGCS